MIRPTREVAKSSELVEVLRQIWQQCANDRRMIEADALDAAIASLPAPQPPAEARPCGRRPHDPVAALRPDTHHRKASPPSAPVGVEDLSCCGGNDETPKSHCMDCSRYPGQLAQQPSATPVGVDKETERRLIDVAASMLNDNNGKIGKKHFRADATAVVRRVLKALAQQPAAAGELAELVGLLDEVRSHFTRDDDLPDDLLPRIDAALRDHEQETKK